jgi:hypothetical protein
MVVKKRNITVELPVYDSEGNLNKDPITSYYKVLSRNTAPNRYPATVDQLFYPRGRTPQSLDNHVFFSPADNQTGYVPEAITPADGIIGNSSIIPQTPLTVEPLGSMTINWSWGGYEMVDNRVAFASADQDQATKFNTDYRREGNLPSNTDTRRIKGNYNSLTAPASLVDRPYESNKDFNMAQEMMRLVQEISVSRIPANSAPVDSGTGETYQLPANTRSTGNPNEGEDSYLRGIEVTDFPIPTLIQRQINASGWNGTAGEWLDQNQVDLGNGNVRRAENALEVQRIIEESNQGTDRPRRAALVTYSQQMYLTQSLHTYRDFEFYDFQVGSSFVDDWLTHKQWNETVSRSDAQGRPRQGVNQRRNANNESRIPKGLAYINPEYNYFNRSYEQAISSSAFPEAILPNMYVYELANGGNGFNINESPEWQGTDRASEELQGNYDTLITLDEFDRNILPRTTDPDFESYFTRYAEATKGQALTVDMYANLNRHNASTITPAGDMDIYPKFNNVKHAYPMYIEINLPTPPLGTFGAMMQRSDLSAPFISSLQEGGETRVHNYTCDSYFAPAGVWRERAARTSDGEQLGSNNAKFDLFADRMSPRFLKWSKAQIHASSRILDFNQWLDGLDTEALVAVLTSNGTDLPVGVEDEQACLNRRSQLMVRQIKTSMARIAREKMVTYKELLVQRDDQNRQEKTYCEAETIVYRIEKKKNLGRGWEKIQEYFLPNTSYVEVLDFVDTQVKYDTTYRYEIYAYAVVYGSTFRFRCREYQVDRAYRTTPNGQQSPVYFSFNVETLPNLKVVEYPVFTKGGETSTTWGNVPKTFPGSNTEFAPAGLTYPDVKVMDRPPCPPEITIIPFRDDYTQIMFNMQPQTGEFIGDRALKFIPLSQEEEEEFAALADYQKRVENYGLRAGHLEFRSEGAEEIDRMEIFRTDEIKANPTDIIDLYSSFSDKLHKVLDITPENNTNEIENALGFDCIDTLNPNKKYYYTCRAIDRHGHKSNPSVIYQVELLYDNGFYSPRMSIYDPAMQGNKESSRSFSRFIEIRAADIQVEPFNLPTIDENGNETPNYKKGLIEDNVDEKVENSAFIVRITSKDTGRKIDLKFRFKSSTRQGNT